MSCPGSGIECDTVQIIEPNGDVIVDTAGTRSDMDERGEVTLTPGQTLVSVTFQVPKLNALYNFEYLYVSATGLQIPGAIQPVVTTRSRTGFTVLLAGAPSAETRVLHWRVTIVSTSTPSLIDAPENIYVRLPNAGLFQVSFVHPRSDTSYGFSELRVENLVDPPNSQAVIRVQVYVKTTVNFGIAVNPRPPTNNYWLKVRTP